MKNNYSSSCFFYYKHLIHLGDAPEITGRINVGYDDDEHCYKFVPASEALKKQSIRNCHHWWLATNDENIKQLGVTDAEVKAFKEKYMLNSLSDLLGDDNFLSESGHAYDELVRLALSKGALRVRKYFDINLVTIMGEENSRKVKDNIIDCLLDNESLYNDYTDISVNFAKENRNLSGGGYSEFLRGSVVTLLNKLQK